MILEAVFGFALAVAAFLAGCWITLWLHERGEEARDAERVERRKGFDIASGFGSETYDWRPDFRASEQGETETR